MSLVLLAGAALITGCSPSPAPPERDDSPTAASRARVVQDLMVRGVALAEIDDWAAAVESFEAALETGGEDPVVLYDLAVCLLRSDQQQRAAETLERIGADAPAEIRARKQYLRGKLALEAGDLETEVEAYRQAMALDPTEPAYPFALAALMPRLGEGARDEVGPLLERALELWPDNARLQAELITWRLGRPDSAEWHRAIDSLTELTADEPAAAALVSRARSELDAEAAGAPTSARRALNLLRPGKRFQADWAALESRLALLPLRRPAGAALLASQPPSEVTVSLERAVLLPEVSLDAEQPIEVVASIDAVDTEATPLRAADLTLLTERTLSVLDRSRSSFRPIGDISGGRRLLAGDLDADGWMERVVLGDEGVAIFRSADSPNRESWSRDAGPAAPVIRDGILVDFELDGDLDLLMVSGSGELLLSLNLGEGGIAVPDAADLPVERGSLLLATDLDGDVDPDLLVAEGERIIVLQNLRQGEYRTLGELPVGGTVDDWQAIDFDGDGRVDLVTVIEGRLRFFRGLGPQGLEPDLERDTAVAALPMGGSPVHSLQTADVDLDGAPDLVVERQVTDGTRAVELLAADRLAVLDRIDDLPPGPGGLLPSDLDRDRDQDLAILTINGLEALATSGAEDQGWVELVLRGLASKVPLDGRGARVDVWFGLERRSLEPTLPEVVVGLGGRAPALVEVTWPNGITELVFEPEAETTQVVKQELRIEGSCPFLYASDGASDGSALRFVTDVLSLAPLGMLADSENYVPADPEEYLRLPDWVAPDPESGRLRLAITEELREVAYLDQVELVVVDTPSGINAYNGERWIEGTVKGLDLRLLGPLESPTSAVHEDGRDVLDIVSLRDHRYLRHSGPGRRYQGAGHARSLELSVSPELAATGRVALLLTGWLHWGNTSTNVARSQDPGGRPIFPFLELPAGDGTWRRVDLAVGLPAGKTKPIVVELGGLLDPTDPRFRITTDFEVYWDWIAAAESLPLAETAHREQRLAPAWADLAFAGFSRWYRPAPDGPYLFDPSDRRPYPWRPTEDGERVLSWSEHEGYYSPYGEATAAVTDLDDRLVIFGSGEELSLDFDLASLSALPEGWRRTYFLHLEGWEKDGDPNVACSETVGPLPVRGAAAYACEEANASAPSQVSSQGRWVDRQRLQRRVRVALAGPDAGRLD